MTLHGSGTTDGLVVTGDAEIEGNIGIEYGSGYDGPAARGDVDSHVVLTANSITGAFDSVDGTEIGGGFDYVGENASGDDGLFRRVTVSSTDVLIDTYYALAGDANGDGAVDISDFNIWNTNKFLADTDWSTGDFNGDGVTDASDFNVWNANKFTSIALPAVAPTTPALDANLNLRTVPEPTTLPLLALAGLGLLRTGLRRHQRLRKTRR